MIFKRKTSEFILSPHQKLQNSAEKNEYSTFTKEFEGILKIPRAGSIFSSLAKETSGWNQAHVTWTHRVSTSVGFRAPPNNNLKKKKSEQKVTWKPSVETFMNGYKYSWLVIKSIWQSIGKFRAVQEPWKIIKGKGKLLHTCNVIPPNWLELKF